MAATNAAGARRLAISLSWTLAGLMTLQSGIGILFPSVYRDPAWVRAAWLGSDIVTLLVGVPLLVGGLLAARRGSVRGELAWYSGLGYGVYNYAYYLFGARLGVLFPLFVAVFVGSVWALVLSLATADVPTIAGSFGPRTSARTVAGYMGLTGSGLAIAWLAQWAAYVFSGTVPSIGEAPFRLVASLDLSVVVPTMLVGAALLWRRRPWGYPIAAIATVKGAVYTLALTLSSIIGGMRGISGSMEQAPVWGVWTLVGLAATLLLLWRVAPLPIADRGETA
jgi:hypothetical protein